MQAKELKSKYTGVSSDMMRNRLGGSSGGGSSSGGAHSQTSGRRLLSAATGIAGELPAQQDLALNSLEFSEGRIDALLLDRKAVL